MGFADLIVLMFLTAVFTLAGWVIYSRLIPAPKPKQMDKGTWRRAQEAVTVGYSESSTIRVVLVREHKGRETGRLVVAEVNNNEPGWTNKLQDALAEADIRLATLNLGEEH